MYKEPSNYDTSMIQLIKNVTLWKDQKKYNVNMFLPIVEEGEEFLYPLLNTELM